MAKTSPTQQQINRAAAFSKNWNLPLKNDFDKTLNQLSDSNASKVIVLLFIGERHDLVKERIAELRVSEFVKFKLNSLFSQLFPPSTDDGFFGDGITSAPYDGC